VACELRTEAVPEMAQVLVARLKPVGRAGVTEQPVITPPVFEGV